MIAGGPAGPGPALVVSLVVATRDRPDRLAPFLARAVAALDGCTGPDGAALAAELVLVDNGARAQVEAALPAPVRADPRVRVVHAALPGLSRARAVGSSAARGAVLVMTDDDVEVDPGWLGRMAAPLLDGRADLVAGRVRLADDPAYPAEPLLRRWLAETDDAAPAPALVGAAMAFRRELLGVALWDPALGAGAPGTGFGEDVLFEWMARRAGARVVRADGPPVVHRPDADRLTRAAWLDAAARRGRSDAYVAHHWLGTDVRLLGLRALRHRAALAAVRRRAAAAGTPGPAELEAV
uniref:glycosyltransferase family 2 protein n=1 Tax=Puerhibacterium puerhi TaxID=2692623 RepID=UPI00135C4786